jgi:hypothetical protein
MGVVLFAIGLALGLLYFSVAALPIFYGLPKSILWAARGKCGWSVPFKYLVSPVLWSVFFLVLFVLLAMFWPSAFATLQESATFNIGSLIGFWGAALRVLVSRSAHNDMAQDFQDFVRPRES